MVRFRTLTGTKTRDINIPRTVKHRNSEGEAIFLVPGFSYEVTDEEWEHIKTVDNLDGIVLL